MRKFELPFHRIKRFGDLYLITTDNGAWLFVTKDEVEQVESGILDDCLFDKLEKKFIIKTPQNSRDFVDKDFRSHWYRSNGASLHIMIPTLRCNHTCKYCYAFRKPEDAFGYDMTEEIADDAVDFVFQSPAKSIVIEFSGGEPLMRFCIGY
jgi:sulfatase maturation enzyme AslB (radical SAM superfamily)